MNRQSISLAVTVITVAAILGLVAPHAGAQVLYGTLVGTVTDPTGSAIVGAEITVTNEGTAQVRSIRTGADGAYTVANLLGGRYRLEVKAGGFKSVRRTSIDVVVNSIRREDLRLDIGEMTETVTVEGSTAALQTEKADVSSELGVPAVKNLPIGGYRNYQSLVNLVPGATPAGFQNAAITRPGRSLTTNVNGTNRNNNVTKLDGALNMSVWLPHHLAYVAPVETIETVNITTNNFDAEQGMAGGAAVTVVTKSGTNELHGSAFAYHENQHLRARGFFERLPQKPKHIRNMDGFTVGGPVLKNKLFFFGGWETSRERASRRGLYTVAPEDQRAGNFSAYNTTLYDPSTGTLDGKNRQPFANNTIPLARQSAISRKIQGMVPLPNQPGLSGNFYATDVQELDRNQFDAKVNWNRTSAHTLWTKYSIMQAPGRCRTAFGEIGGPGLCDTGSGEGDNRAQLATIGHTLVLSPSTVLDGTFGFTRNRIDVTPPGYGRNTGLDTLGIPGTNGPDIRQSGAPQINISGYTGLGDTDNWNPAFQRDQSFTGTTNMAWTRGAHNFRYGFEFARHTMNHWQPELGPGPRGALNFGYGPTVLNGGRAGNMYNGYATFLLGLTTSVAKSDQWESMTTKEWQWGFYFRDRWQLGRNTTVVLGVRYELYPLLTRSHTGIEYWDPETNIMTRGGIGENPENVGIEVSHKLFAPRFGLTHRLGSKTVIRTGYGITYNPMPMSRPLRGSYPMTIDANFPAVNSFTWYSTLENGIPLFTGENPSASSFALPGKYTVRTVWNPDGSRKLNRGYIQSWNFIAERELPGSMIGTVGYVGTKTIRGFVDWNADHSAPGTGLAGSQMYQKFGRTAATYLFNGWTSAEYHSMQATLNRNFKNGLMIKSSYTWSKALNMQDDDGGWVGVMWNWAPVMDRNWARAGYDIPHNLHLGFVYELPFGKGKSWAQEGWASYLFGNWQANGVFYAYQGRPFTVTAPGTSLNSRGNSQTADQVKPVVDKLGGVGADEYFFDPTAFAAVKDVRFGTSGRNILRAPGVVGLDSGLFRSFPISERKKLEFRTEAFNLTNTPRFGGPTTDVTNVNFMRILGASGERQVRFGLRLEF
ncbi:MAG TPA: TonB-dependent receptor [Bryobacteraceae bacterium]|nr:TonB-dependent receptor [Bryobacteraceae bacterium]